jgi:hypothetical protein
MSRWIRVVKGGIVSRGIYGSEETPILAHENISVYSALYTNNVSACVAVTDTELLTLSVMTGDADPVRMHLEITRKRKRLPLVRVLNDRCCLLKFSKIHSSTRVTFVLKTPTRETSVTTHEHEHYANIVYTAQDIHDTSRTYLQFDKAYTPPWQTWVSDFTRSFDLSSCEYPASRVELAVSEQSHDSVYGHMTHGSDDIIVRLDLRVATPTPVYSVQRHALASGRWNLRNLRGQIYAVDRVDRIASIFDERAYAMVGTDIEQTESGAVLFCTFERPRCL